jgi:hypothetical protein
MRYSDFAEQGTVGSTPLPTAGGSAVPPTSAPANPALSGNVAALQDPRMQAAQLAKQKQEKEKQKKAIQDQIAALQRQLSDLSRTP